MSAWVELNLGLILFLPWFAILATLYLLYPRQPRGNARRAFDIAALLLSTLAFVFAIHWAHASADPTYGRMWQQVLATAVGYGVFLAVLGMAWAMRRAWLQGRAA